MRLINRKKITGFFCEWDYWLYCWLSLIFLTLYSEKMNIKHLWHFVCNFSYKQIV